MIGSFHNSENPHDNKTADFVWLAVCDATCNLLRLL